VFFCCSKSSVSSRILGIVSTLVLPSWVVSTIDAVTECERVCHRRLALGPYRTTTRDVGVSAALVWLTLGEVSPLTHRFGGGSWDPAEGDPADGSRTWTSSATWQMARAESWVALCVAAGASAPTPEDWHRLGVEPAPAVIDDREFAYGAWRTMSWCPGCSECARTSRSTRAGTGPPGSSPTDHICAHHPAHPGRMRRGGRRSEPPATRLRPTPGATGSTYASASTPRPERRPSTASAQVRVPHMWRLSSSPSSTAPPSSLLQRASSACRSVSSASRAARAASASPRVLTSACAA